jgi:hypothetical protein
MDHELPRADVWLRRYARITSPLLRIGPTIAFIAFNDDILSSVDQYKTLRTICELTGGFPFGP